MASGESMSGGHKSRFGGTAPGRLGLGEVSVSEFFLFQEISSLENPVLGRFRYLKTRLRKLPSGGGKPGAARDRCCPHRAAKERAAALAGEFLVFERFDLDLHPAAKLDLLAAVVVPALNEAERVDQARGVLALAGPCGAAAEAPGWC